VGIIGKIGLRSSQIFNGKQPFGNDTWANVNVPDPSRIRAALDQIRIVRRLLFHHRRHTLATCPANITSLKFQVVSVFEYLNDITVNSKLTQVYKGASAEWRLFQSTVNKVRPGGNYDTYLLWREFMENFFGRMTLWVRTWAADHLDQLEDTWREVYNVAPDAPTRDLAFAYLQEIEVMRERVRRIRFDTSMFIYMG
jgi:hypothetical protein